MGEELSRPDRPSDAVDDRVDDVLTGVGAPRRQDEVDKLIAG
jgi:hypothetical protein